MASKTIDKKLKILQDIGQVLLDQNIEDNSVRAKAFENINPSELQVSLSETKQLIRPENDAYVDYFGKSYNPGQTHLMLQLDAFALATLAKRLRRRWALAEKSRFFPG